MSIFGKLDAANIPTNPYFVEEGNYRTAITKAFFKTGRDDQRQLVIEFEIIDENSQFKGNKVQKYFNLVDPEMTAETFQLLPADEQSRIRKANSALKNTLCGNGRRKGLGVNPEDLNDENWNPEVLVGLSPVVIGVNNYGPDNQGVNVSWANLDEE